MSRNHPLLGKQALPEIVIPIAPPHAVRQFQLPSCMRSGTTRPDATERDPTRETRWFLEGDALLFGDAGGVPLAGPTDVTQELPGLCDDREPGRPVAWWLSMAIVTLAAIALVCAIVAG